MMNFFRNNLKYIINLCSLGCTLPRLHFYANLFLLEMLAFLVGAS